MNLLETIESDLHKAMKQGDSIKTETLRMLKSDLMYEKAKTGKDLNDEQMLDVITRAAKRRKESIEEFSKAKRDDLAQQEAAELQVIQSYLPEQLSEEELERVITEKLQSFGSVTKKDFGQIMGTFMKDLKGKADGKLVKDILMRKLQG